MLTDASVTKKYRRGNNDSNTIINCNITGLAMEHIINCIVLDKFSKSGT